MLNSRGRNFCTGGVGGQTWENAFEYWERLLQGALSLEHILFFLKLQRGIVESKPFGRVAPPRKSIILY